jgi:glycosyltransferase involved in cell wall biosynthesis
LRVLLVNKFLYPSRGAETVFFATWRALEQHGHRVIPFGMLDQRNVKVAPGDYLVSNVDYSIEHPLLHIGRTLTACANLVYSFEARRKFEALAEATRPDIVHLHNIYHQISPSILHSAAKLNLPVVHTLHDFKLVCPNYRLMTGRQRCERCVSGRFYHAIVHRCVKNSFLRSILCCTEMYVHRFLKTYDRVDQFICPSQFLRSKLAEFGVEPNRMTVVPNGLSLRTYSESAATRDYILYFGSLSAGKGLTALLQAFAEVSCARNTRLLIAGEGELKPDLEHQIASDERLSKVELLGFVQGGQLRQLIQECLFVVNPSELYEICPMNILEAFAHGKAVLASNIGGIPELVEPGATGLLFRPGDVASLARQMQVLLTDTRLATHMGRAARKRVDESYSMDLYYERILRVYQEVSARRRAGAVPAMGRDGGFVKIDEEPLL